MDYYHAWLRNEGGSQAWGNRDLHSVLTEVVVPYVNKHIAIVGYGAGQAILNFGSAAYLVVLRTAEKLEDTSPHALYVAVANGTHENCTREVLDEALVSRADERAKSLIQRALAAPLHRVFVVMRIGDRALDSAYEGVIKPVVKESGFDCLRIDEVKDSGLIGPQILDAIASSEVVLCDLSGERPNCYYETGFADALGRTLILTIRKGETRHFDIAGRRFILWETEQELRIQLRERLAALAGKKDFKIELHE